MRNGFRPLHGIVLAKPEYAHNWFDSGKLLWTEINLR